MSKDKMGWLIILALAVLAFTKKEAPPVPIPPKPIPPVPIPPVPPVPTILQPDAEISLTIK